MKVIFSDRAYTALLAETYEKIKTETGGILLGFFENDTWYVVESIDPGPRSIFEVAYFEYDQKYVSHLINKIARLYKRNLSLVGLWHRHPGSFDVFSMTDDGTNRSYAQLAPQGAISCLVNIDPKFRLTVYHVPKTLAYKKLPFEVGDQYFPQGSMDLLTHEMLLRKINGEDYAAPAPAPVRQVSSVKLSKIMNSICENLEEFDGAAYKSEIFAASRRSDFVDVIFGEIIDDFEYLSDTLKIAVNLKKTNHYLCVYDVSEDKETRIFFSFIEGLNKFLFIYKNKCYSYESGLISRTIAGSTAAAEPVAEANVDSTPTV